VAEPPKAPPSAVGGGLPRDAAIDRATALFRAGNRDAARAILEGIVAAAPQDAVAWNNLGNVRLAAGDPETAAADYRRAAAIRPDFADAHANLAHVLARRGAVEAAVAAARQALALRPDFPEAEVTLGYALSRLGDIAAGIACFRRAIALRPDFATAHWNLALLLLLDGDAAGWAEYEWRWRNPDFFETRRIFAAPEWRGEPPEALAGPILVYAEQGFGDTIQFCRYVPLLAARGHRVILEVQPALHTLIWSSFGAAEVDVVARMPSPNQLQGAPRIAAHVPLMSLPGRLGPAPAGRYLAAEPGRTARWRARLGDGFRLGLVWRGSPTHPEERDRSIAAEMLAPLAAIAGVRLVSLQRGGDEDRAMLGGRAMLAAGPELLDFADTAALVAALDFVVSVDTAVAHLTGALGKPGAVLLPFVPDWRWRRDGDATPWYPSLRLYRQRRRGDWVEAIARLAADLAGLVRGG
jgi:Flp pilus assembly protein TadD